MPVYFVRHLGAAAGPLFAEGSVNAESFIRIYNRQILILLSIRRRRVRFVELILINN